MNGNTINNFPMPEPTPKPRHRMATQLGYQSPSPRDASKLQAADGLAGEFLMKPLAFMPKGFKDLPHLFRQDDPTHMVSEAVTMMRRHLKQEMGDMPTSALQKFVQVFLSDDELVESYFMHRVREDAVGRQFAQRGSLLTATPWVEAKRAGGLAMHSEVLRGFRHEQVLAWVAAWAMPSGTFHLCHPKLKSKGLVMSDLGQARNNTVVMVEEAVFAMRRIDPQTGSTLSALLGVGYSEEQDPNQLARLGTALHLSQRHINNMWIPASGWAGEY
ncbi:hypothetical protein [Hydrogenophaga sp.]|uniref:hypothetical protein n=1 Tax=Hydrogenophaga sp. TaxID=1904254 RepID=UPI0027324698|nr:hypothetical protein [Hydrogenophaga sp.]MDP3474433.1 hypothetical protein [Hydrogenophaga sp.]